MISRDVFRFEDIRFREVLVNTFLTTDQLIPFNREWLNLNNVNWIINVCILLLKWMLRYSIPLNRE